MISESLAYFLTLHTYGTWLVGDARGYVQDHQNHVGEPLLYGRPGKRVDQLKQRPLTLDIHARTLLQETMMEVCKHRNWTLFALHVRTNHVHIVLRAETKVSKVMVDLKAYVTRALRMADIVKQNESVWSRHGSTRYLTSEDEVRRAVEYTCHQQGLELHPPPFKYEDF